ncbi:MAG: AAA family ATPase [Acidobacteriota bacterium]|jgi:predicted AAA+ superfamily ATPase|nr:AAA family ATPase [Acidobacteriota bacterium]
MKRKIYKDLLAWKNSGAAKPLMVVGARQVGKTYTINEFCKAEFEDYLHFNLLDNADLRQIFHEEINTAAKIAQMELLVGRRIDFERTVIFFDEIQESEELIAAMKHFAESETKYRIICAGSLLGVKIKRMQSAFPVGKVKMLEMYPMDFEEFLEASGETLFAEAIREQVANPSAFSEPLHRKGLELQRKYLCVGGMPEAVANLLSVDGSVLGFDASILKDIRTGYLNDMSKHIRNPLETSRIESVYNSIPSQLGNSSGKFMYAEIRKGARARSYESALSWLVSSRMVYECKMVSTPAMPLKGYEAEGYFKLYLNDPGLLCSLLEIRSGEIMLGRDFYFKGILNESYIAGQFKATGKSLYYWRSGNQAEVDFLLDTPDGIAPVEAKSGKTVRSASLGVYRETFHPKKCIRVSERNFGCANDIVSIPLYAAHCL